MCFRDEAAAQATPVEPLDVEIGEAEALLPAGTISSILEGTIVVQVCYLVFLTHWQLACCAGIGKLMAGQALCIVRCLISGQF